MPTQVPTGKCTYNLWARFWFGGRGGGGIMLEEFHSIDIHFTFKNIAAVATARTDQSHFS